jgi:hypothetical protein
LTSAWEGEVELVKKSEYEAYAAGEISDPRD